MNRYITLPMKLRALFSSFHAKFALMFVFVEAAVVLLLFLVLDMKALKFTGNANIKNTSGKVFRIRATSVSVNKVRIRGYHFKYRIPGEGVDRLGVSYKTGYYSLVGKGVLIEYLVDEPDIARIKGMSTGIISPIFGLLALPVFIIGIWFAISGWRKGRDAVAVLERGEIIKGRLLTETPTSRRLLGRRVMACTFGYTVGGQKYTITARSHLPERVKDDQEERIVYNPDKPEQAILFDLLPKKVRAMFEGSM